MSQAGAQAACDLSLSSGWGHVTAAPRLQIQLQEEAAYGPGPGGEGTRPPGQLLAWAREAKPGPLPFQPPAVTLAQMLNLSEPPYLSSAAGSLTAAAHRHTARRKWEDACPASVQPEHTGESKCCHVYYSRNPLVFHGTQFGKRCPHM